MNIFSLITAALLAVAATTGVVHADDKATDPKAAKARTDEPVTKPHSHAQEKTGVPRSMPDSETDKPNASKDQSKHFHPRDGK